MADQFHFLRPDWLWLLLPMVWLLWRLLRSDGNADAWRSLVDAHLLPRLLADGGGPRRLPRVLLGLGWLLGVLALAGPTWARLPQPVYQAQDYRVLALDLSPSMNATDLSPSRLAHARFKLLDLLRKVRDGQTALLAYGAEPYLVAPLTSDTNTIAAQVPSLETGLLPVQGAKRTDLALDMAGDLLQQVGAPDGEVILISDGLDHPAAAGEAARRLRNRGYRVSVLGIGSAKGAPIPAAGGGFLKDSKGNILLSNLDVGALQTLAHTGGGRYVTAGPDDRDIEALVGSDHANLRNAVEKQDAKADQWREEGPWLLLLLLPLAAFAFRRGWLAPLALLMLLGSPPQAHAFGWSDLWQRPDQQAAGLLQAGDTAKAAETFQRPDWRAAAQYQAGDYQQALETLDGVQDPDSAYNRGNTLARLGDLKQALAAYDQALEENPRDADARHNRDLVQKLLDRQQAQERQQSPQDQKKQGQSSGQQDQQRSGEPQQQGQRGQQQSDQRQQQGRQQSGQQQQNGQQEPQKSGEKQGQQGQPQPGEQQGQHEQQRPKSDGQTRQAEADRQEQPGKEKEKGESRRSDEKAEEQKAQQAGTGKEEQEPKGPEREKAQSARASRRESSGKRSEQQQPSPPSEPGLTDLTGKPQTGSGASIQSAAARIDPEDLQAMEQMLRRVEDDPGGLLRQRFLLQHLRRTGQL